MNPHDNWCSACRTQFHFAHAFDVHVLQVHGSSGFRCDMCQTSYKQEPHLRQHKVDHHGTVLRDENDPSRRKRPSTREETDEFVRGFVNGITDQSGSKRDGYWDALWKEERLEGIRKTARALQRPQPTTDMHDTATRENSNMNHTQDRSIQFTVTAVRTIDGWCGQIHEGPTILWQGKPVPDTKKNDQRSPDVRAKDAAQKHLHNKLATILA